MNGIHELSDEFKNLKMTLEQLHSKYNWTLEQENKMIEARDFQLTGLDVSNVKMTYRQIKRAIIEKLKAEEEVRK